MVCVCVWCGVCGVVCAVCVCVGVWGVCVCVCIKEVQRVDVISRSSQYIRKMHIY